MVDRISVISDTLHGLILMSSFEKTVMSTTLFNRLHGIYQNSTAYLTYPANRTRRVEHSLGTMYLCGNIFYSGICNAKRDVLKEFFQCAGKNIDRICELIQKDAEVSVKLGDKFSKFKRSYSNLSIEGGLYNKYLPSSISEFDEKRIYAIVFEAVRTAALLHDVGHPPFSHISENSLIQLYDEVVELENKTERQKLFLEIMSNYISKDKNTHKRKKLHEEMGNLIAQQAIFEAIPDLTEKEAQNSECYKNQVFKLIVRQLVTEILTASEEKEENNFARDLHRIIDGTLDGDRLDYVSRDPINSGFSVGKIEYDRLINSTKLIEKNHSFLFCPCTSVCNTIEDFLQRRWNMYKNIIYHHRVVKTDYLLQNVIVLIAREYLGQDGEQDNSKNSESNDFILPYDISGLWKAVQSRPSRTEMTYSISQWDDTWLMTILKKYYFENCIDDDSILHKQLEELLTNRKNYFSLVKRKEEFAVIDRAAAEAMQEREKEVKKLVEEVRKNGKTIPVATNTDGQEVGENKDYLSLIEKLWAEAAEYLKKTSFVQADGFLLNKAAKVINGVSSMEEVIKRSVNDYCNHDGSFFSVFKPSKTGTGEDLYLYNKREEPSETLGLDQVSNIRRVLEQDSKFSTLFFVYVERSRINEKDFLFDETRKKIGHEIGAEIYREITEILNGLL